MSGWPVSGHLLKGRVGGARRRFSVVALLALAALLALLPAPAPTGAQTPTDCGVVDAIGYPIDGVSEAGDDFGKYRARFGGLHTGVDVAFYRYGEPVYAAARGRVTYSDPEGWDTEKGVVIVEHTFPDGEVFYTLYGHMESIGDYFFPGVGQCVTPETVVGVVGDPSLSAPHLHFEVRTFGPDDGGPGYWETNPLEAGWRHPLDFIRLAQVRLAGQDGSGPAPYISHVTGLHPPSVPPLVTDEGGLVVASGTLLEGISPQGRLRWRMELSNTVAGMVALPEGRILARMTDNSVLVLREGRYEALWLPELPLTGAPMRLGEAVAFLTADNAVAAYTPQGTPLWSTPPLGERVSHVSLDGDRIAVGVRSGTQDDSSAAWHLVGSGGRLLYQVAPAHPPLAAFGPQDDYYLLDGATLYHISAELAPTPLARLPHPAGRSAALVADGEGNVYVFTLAALGEGVLLAYDPSGALRWEATLPGTHPQPPLLASGEGCLLYALAADGTLYALGTQDGAIRGQAHLYAGGANGQPNARLLEVLPGERVRFGAGFLSVVTLDGYALAGLEAGACPP